MPPTGLKGSALNRVRSNATRMMQDTCTVLAEVEAQDSFGASIKNMQTIADNVPCRLSTLTAQNLTASGLVGSQESMKDTYQLIIKQGTALAINQKVVINNLTYSVIALITELTNDVFESAVVTRQR